MASRYKTTLKGVLILIAIGSLFWVAGQVLIGEFFLSPVRIALFVALPALVGLAAVVLLFLPPAVQVLSLICGVAAVIAVFAAGIYRDVQASRQKWTGWTPWHVTEDMLYPRMCGKYVDAMEGDGRIASVLTWQGGEVQPVGGISANHLGGGVYSDHHGFLNPPGQWRQDEVEILAVGDSFAAGADIQHGKGFVDLIRNGLGSTVNLGCSWNGPLFELASLVEYGPIVRPKLVAWFFYEGNDLIDLELERHSPLLMRYLQEGFEQGLSEKQTVIDVLLKDYVDARLRRLETPEPENAVPLSYVVYGDPAEKVEIDWENVLALWNHRLPWVWEYGRYRDTFGLLHEVLARAAEITAGWDGRFVFVYLPGKHRFRNDLGRIEADAYRQEVLRVVKSLGIPLIDLTPIFERRETPRSLFDGHYSIEGNALVATTFVTAIESGLPTN